MPGAAKRIVLRVAVLVGIGLLPGLAFVVQRPGMLPFLSMPVLMLAPGLLSPRQGPRPPGAGGEDDGGGGGGELPGGGRPPGGPAGDVPLPDAVPSRARPRDHVGAPHPQRPRRPAREPGRISSPPLAPP